MNSKKKFVTVVGDGLYEKFSKECKARNVSPSVAIRQAIILLAQESWGITIEDDTLKRGQRR